MASTLSNWMVEDIIVQVELVAQINQVFEVGLGNSIDWWEVISSFIK